jgi:signal transduction histidine kinase
MMQERSRGLLTVLCALAMVTLLGLLVWKTIANERRDIQVDGISIDDRKESHRHDEQQDDERHSLQQQINALGERIKALEQKR